MTEPQTVAVAEISVDRRYLRQMVAALGGNARARPEHDAPWVARYAHALRKGATFPPIVAVRSSDRKLFLLDGLHRLKAHRAIGRATIEAIVLSDTDFQAALPRATLTRLPAGRGVSVSVPFELGPGPPPRRGGRVFKFCRWLIECLRWGRKQ